MAKKPEFERTSITLPKGTLEKARNAGLNVSSTAAKAVIEAVKKLS